MTLKKIEQVILFLSLLALPTQLGRHFWPEFSYIYSLRVDYLSPTIYLWDLLVLPLILTWLLKKPKVNILALNLFLTLLLSQSLSLIYTPNLGAGVFRLEQYFTAGIFGVYLASQKFTFIKEQLFLPLILSLVYSCLLGVWQFFTGKTLGLWILGERAFSITTPGIAKFDFYGQEFLRPYASFPHPNVLAAYLLVISFLIKALNVSFGKTAQVFGNLFAGLVVLMTVSRVIILPGLAALFFILKGRWRTGIIIILILLSPILYTRYSALFSFDSLTLIRREQLAYDGIRIFASSPLFGVGLNNFIGFSSSTLVAGPSRFLQPVHNIYLLILAETGVIGFLGWLVFLGFPIWRSFKEKGFLIIWLLVLFLGFFDHYFLTLPQGYRMLLLIWGVCMSLVCQSSEKYN